MPVEQICLLHHTEFFGSAVQVHVDPIGDLESTSELRFRPPHALGNSAYFAVIRRQEHENSIGLAEGVGAEYDGFVVELPHRG